jgi:hypothetical protein
MDHVMAVLSATVMARHHRLTITLQSILLRKYQQQGAVLAFARWWVAVCCGWVSLIVALAKAL